MNKNEVGVTTVQLDIEKIEVLAETASRILDGLSQVVDNIAGQIVNMLESALSSVELLSGGLERLVKCFTTVTEWDFSGVLTELTEISDTLDEILKKINEPDWVGIASVALQGVDFMFGSGGLGKNVFQTKKGKYDSGKTSLFGTSKGKYSAPRGTDISASSIAAGGIGAAVGLDSMDGTLGDILGDVSEGGGLTAMFSSLSAVVSDAGQKMRDFGSAIGTAFSNFGSFITQLATSTGTWIANTAAKVGNTAAQWAQTAAVTAWNAICSVGTAVTTAFGAAMSFLTSPIGLVVLAIVALIAIIALLIANWDTVKAAVLTAWEAIKGALATAADWVNTNVIQPVVGFFKTAFEWISTKLQAGFAFVQSIFAGISSFMQGVFAGDCRFSEVLFEDRVSES